MTHHKYMEFKIRGHHIPLYADHLKEGAPFSQEAGDQTKYALNAREVNPERRAYWEDVIGTSRDDALTFFARQEVLWQRFQDLGAEDSVAIVAGKPDDMCRTCIVGEHCGLNDSSRFDPSGFFLLDEPDGTRSDRRALEEFREKADEMGVPYEVLPDRTEFTDVPQRETEQVIISAADFKRVAKKLPTEKSKK
jgi:hypothetical protein